MQIGTVAEKSGISAKAIRYYESIGLIDAALRTHSGYRVYGLRDVQTLRFIQRARSLGFSVGEVAHLLMLWRDTNRHSAQVKALAEDHVEGINRKTWSSAACGTRSSISSRTVSATNGPIARYSTNWPTKARATALCQRSLTLTHRDRAGDPPEGVGKP